jgi:hypothetical protein
MHINRAFPRNLTHIFLLSGFLLLLYQVSRAITDSNYYIIVGVMGIGLLLYLFENAEKTVYLLFLGILFLDWLSEKWFLIPRQITWLPEVLSIIVFLYILLTSAKYKNIPLKPPYVLVYFFVGLTFLGILINKVDAWVAIAGVRNHLKFLPFFLLPFYYDFSDDFMKKFIKFILFFSFLQCPVAVLQRLLYETRSGDFVGGTLGANTSGTLSLFCAFMIIIWTAYYFKYQLKVRNYLLGSLLLFLPMAISETKISLFLIPLIFFSIILFIPEAKRKIRYFVFVFVSIGMLLVAYRCIYNYFYASGPKRGIETYITSPERTLDYIYYRKFTESGTLNRIPQIVFAYSNIKNDVKHLLFGVGAGAASDSFFQRSGGSYYITYKPFEIDNIFIANMLWEYGILGTLLYLSMSIYIFFKIYSLRIMERTNGIIAIGFLGMSVVMLLSTVYLNTTRVNIYIYLYWFLSGYLVNLYYFKTSSQKDTARNQSRIL